MKIPKWKPDHKNLHVAVFDLNAGDCTETAQTVKKIFTDLNLPVKITEYTDVQPFVLDYEEKFDEGELYDMAFVSVENMLGVEAVRAVRGMDRKLPLCFVGGIGDFGAESFRLSALHYIGKPVYPADAREAVARITDPCYEDRCRQHILLYSSDIEQFSG
jgi:two-component SAPR family response regulator